VSDWRFQSLEQLQESSSDEDEFYDAQGKVNVVPTPFINVHMVELCG